MLIRTGAASQDVNQGARHIVFVEGTPDGFDVTVLGELLTPRLRVEPLGASLSVRSVAAALHPFRPDYWFIVDRDDWDDATVEASWRTFPNPAHDNLLIWRRKELESYFLEPAWLSQSRYYQARKGTDLPTWLATEANKVLWLEAANRVLVATRNQVKRSESALFSANEVAGLTRDEVVQKLLTAPLVRSLRTTSTHVLEPAHLEAAFDEQVTLLTGGHHPLAWNQGRWRDLMSAKALFRSMINQWCNVPDRVRGGKATLQGREAQRVVAIDLLKNHQDTMPADFVELRRILDSASQT
jgi:hypothetical protein